MTGYRHKPVLIGGNILDHARFRLNLRHYRQVILTGETVIGKETADQGAEGATAPETLRHRDRGMMALWRVRGFGCCGCLSTEGEDDARRSVSARR